jgi:hypothetical protein
MYKRLKQLNEIDKQITKTLQKFPVKKAQKEVCPDNGKKGKSGRGKNKTYYLFLFLSLIDGNKISMTCIFLN